MKRISNKKGYINDVITGGALLIGFFVMLSICIFLLMEWNSAVQNSSAFTAEAKQGQQDFTDQYPEMIGWLFPAVLVGLFLYTIITAYLVEVISKVWLVVGLVVTIIQAIISYVIGQVFQELSSVSLFGTSAAYIPGATLYFGNVILFNSIWAMLILLVLYFKAEG